MKKRLKHLTVENFRAAAVSWFRQRIDLGPAVALASKKTVPMHRGSWIYLLGGAAMFLFGLQVASGCLLMLYYQPTEAAAHESVRRIMTEVPCGWLIRGMHVWGANLFIGVVILHFLSVLFTRAYRKPRELTWISGVAMLLMALALGFSGYLLPWNELSYYATLVGTDVPSALPGVGDLIKHFLRGGAEVTGDTITRFYAAHVMLVPLTFALVLSIHLALIQAQGMSLPLGMTEKEVKGHRPFFAEFALIDAGVWLLLFGTLVTLAVFLPAEIGVKADLLKSTPPGIKPEWYFLFMFQTLKILPAFLFGIAGELVGVAFFGLVGLLLLVLPWLDRNALRERKSPLFTAAFLILLAYVLVFECWAAGLLRLHWFRLADMAVALGAALGAAGTMVSLGLLWLVIGFVVFYLRQLFNENTRVRKLYQGGPKR